VVRFENVAYTMNTTVVRVALVRQQCEGLFHVRQELADAVGASRSTVSRFISGKPVSLQLTLKILDKLDLRFEDVFTRQESDQTDSRD